MEDIPFIEKNVSKKSPKFVRNQNLEQKTKILKIKFCWSNYILGLKIVEIGQIWTQIRTHFSKNRCTENVRTNFIPPKMCVDEMNFLANVGRVRYFVILLAKKKTSRKRTYITQLALDRLFLDSNISITDSWVMWRKFLISRGRKGNTLLIEFVSLLSQC